jgi:hypothetical protein
MDALPWADTNEAKPTAILDGLLCRGVRIGITRDYSSISHDRPDVPLIIDMIWGSIDSQSLFWVRVEVPNGIGALLKRRRAIWAIHSPHDPRV